MCQQRKVAVQTIKSLARGPWAAGVPRSHGTWYQPLEERAGHPPGRALGPGAAGIFLNSVGDVDLLPAVLRAADELASGEPEVPDEVMAALAKRAGLASIFGL